MATTSAIPRKKWYQFDVRKVEFVKLKPMHLAALIPISVALNFAGALIAQSVKLPLYLDFGGTILTTLVGGWIPGVTVGILTCIINGLLVDPADFLLIPMPLLGVTVLWLCLRNGWGRTWLGFIVSLLLFSFSLTLVSAPVITFAYGGFTGSSVDIAKAVIAASTDSILSAAFIVDGLMSIIDKGILFFVVIAILRALPPHWRVASPIHVD